MNLEFTGERMVPEGSGESIFWEHIYRYRFASKFVQGKNVLDIACGEGHGTAALVRAGALRVFGVDVDWNTIRHARIKYDINTCQASAKEIPLESESMDVIVSFETIEHLQKPDEFLAESRRILRQNGILILSTPNREVYSASGKHNSYHETEFTLDEIQALVKPYLRISQTYFQRALSVADWSWISLASDKTDLVNVRGFWRLRDILRSVAHAQDWDETLTPEHRYGTVETVLNSDHRLAFLVNRYHVRKYSSWHRVKPYYYIFTLKK